MKWFHGISWGTPVSDIGWVWVILAVVLGLLAWAIWEFLHELDKPYTPPPTPRLPPHRTPTTAHVPPGVIPPQRGHMSSRKRTQIR